MMRAFKSLLLRRSPGSKQLIVNDVFHFDVELQALRDRPSSAPSARHPIVTKRLANMITSQRLRLQHFFRPFCFPSAVSSLDTTSPSTLRPICRQLLTSAPRRTHSPPLPSALRGPRLPLNSIRFFKRRILSLDAGLPPPLLFLLSGSAFGDSRFLSLRALFGFHTIPQNHPSPHCTICPGSVDEDLQHFLFLCPPKLIIWRHVVQLHISSVPLSDAAILTHLQDTLHCSSSFLSQDDSVLGSPVSIYQIFMMTLLAIWQAHWRWIFDRSPILPHNVLTAIERSIDRLATELLLDQ
ncbi:hypothetical protein [Parasitella parasitica]|uniref:Reverse transcriptase zinc-binding domain-containing protein n=1 Tax=Parasitella parasitica TaxID=35722 RepID=A0A0B7N6I8_9FUNG|nr:hypothetical protein [Parasitella parasitica]